MTCSVQGCGAPVLARGWCSAHHGRWLRHGHPQTDIPVLRHGSLATRLEQQIAYEPNTGCWLWMGCVNRGGYGRISRGGRSGKSALVHRVSYSLHRGSVPPGYELDHLCRQRSCLNPEHLEIVTRKVNIARGDGPRLTRLKHQQRTHCKWGHPFTADNTRWQIDHRNGARCRQCIECSRLNQLKAWKAGWRPPHPVEELLP